jgi:hypothetical protein
MVDRELTRDIQRLAEDIIPPVPWLDDRVMAAVLAAAEQRVATRKRRVPFALGTAVTAALVIAALVVGVLVGSRLAAHTDHVPAGPSRDPAVVGYRALIDRDLKTIDFSFQQESRCQTRESCTVALAQTKTGTQALLRDMTSARVPASVSAAALRIEGAAQQFVIHLDAASALIQQPNSDYISSSQVPTIHDLDVSVAAVDCWPALPLEGDHGITCS